MLGIKNFEEDIKKGYLDGSYQKLRIKKKSWMTFSDFMKERRNQKNKMSSEYDNNHKVIRKNIREVNKREVKERRAEIEIL